MVAPRILDPVKAYVRLTTPKNAHLHGATIPLLSFDVTELQDTASGMGCGQRSHEPIKITKKVDGHSLPIFFAYAGKQVFPSVDIVVVKAHPSGVGFVQHRVTLTNVTIRRVQKTVPDPRHSQLTDTHEYEVAMLAFERIVVQGKPGGTMNPDSWQARE
jgi:type VI secretion system Hcp family effector